VWVI